MDELLIETVSGITKGLRNYAADMVTTSLVNTATKACPTQ
jgi:hypothetical protein